MHQSEPVKSMSTSLSSVLACACACGTLVNQFKSAALTLRSEQHMINANTIFFMFLSFGFEI
jgi:hypothetical protein